MILSFLKFIYNLSLYFSQPIIWIRLLLLSKKIPDYRRRISERYGFCRKKVVPQGILLHSVSLGEAISASPLINKLRQLYPLLPITVTTMTPTGSNYILSAFGKNIYHVYLPYDLPCAMNRFLNYTNPKLVIIMETELWPNMIFSLHERHIPLIIVNARLTNKSAKGYSKLGIFTRHMFTKINLVIAQSREDGERFISLGVKNNQLMTISNLKFDTFITPELTKHINTLKNQWNLNRHVWIAGSTCLGEEQIILQAHRKLLEKFSDLLLILAPRHPERFKKVFDIVKRSKFNYIIRSTNITPSINTEVVIIDTIGELIWLYGIADIAFVGGSLVEYGGHNPLEPAAHAIPIIMGKHTSNFKHVCIKLQQSHGLIIVKDVKSIIKTVSFLLSNENYRLEYGKRAFTVLKHNNGVICHLLDLLKRYLP